MSYNFVYFQEVGVYGSRHVPPQAAWTVNPLWSLGGVYTPWQIFFKFPEWHDGFPWKLGLIHWICLNTFWNQKSATYDFYARDMNLYVYVQNLQTSFYE